MVITVVTVMLYLLQGLLTVQAGGGHLRQEDGHVLLLLSEPDEPLPDMSVHHAERHLLLTAQCVVEVCEVRSHTGPSVLRRAGNLRGTPGEPLTVSLHAQARCRIRLKNKNTEKNLLFCTVLIYCHHSMNIQIVKLHIHCCNLHTRI